MTTGCNNGLLTDPKAYFFSVIDRSEGHPAHDWEVVLQASGIPATPSNPSMTPVPMEAPHYGITQWKGSSGNVRGRLSLPTTERDDLGYATHSIDVLADAPDGNGLVWAWRDVGGPPYVPRPCDATTTPNPPFPPTGGLNYAAIGEIFAGLVGPIVRVETSLLQAQVARLQRQVDELAGASQPEPTPLPKKIALKDSRGQYLCADRDRAEGVNVPILANRDGRGEWETFSFEPVE